MNRPPALLFGIAIENVTMDDTIELIGKLVTRGRELSKTHQIATVNVDFLANALDDPSLAEVLRTADVCLADGMPIVWASSRLGVPIVERVAGADLVPRLFDEAQTRGWRIHVLGSSQSVAERSRRLIAERYPRANVSIDPGPLINVDAAVEPEVLEQLDAIDADILCVALGNPKQERFIVRHRDRLRTPVMIGVGGSLDMMVGERRRAPRWVQEVGMEWIVRALQEPKRLGVRYARDFKEIGPWLVREIRAQRGRRARAGLRIDGRSQRICVELGAEMTASESEWSTAADHVAAGAELRIDVAGAEEINDRDAARLIGLVKIARRGGRPVAWVTDPRSMESAFRQLLIAPALADDHEEWQVEREE